MKKTLKTALITCTLVMAMTVACFANPVNDLKDKLIGIGVPSRYVGNVIEYLQVNKITDGQINAVMNKVDQAMRIIGTETDLSKLPVSSKTQLQKLAVEAGNIVGVKVTFGKDSNGVTTLTVLTKSGGVLMSLTTLDVIDIITNFDPEELKEVIQAAGDFSQEATKPGGGDENGNGNDNGNGGSGDFKPGEGGLTDTATGYGNLIVGGTSMMAAGGGMFLCTRKKF